MGQVTGHKNLLEIIESDPDAKKGFFVDTNILFAADYDLDAFNEEAVEICEAFARARIPIYSNSIIRSELLELKRRVLVTESLIDFYHQAGSKIPPTLFAKLKSIRDRASSRWSKGESFFLSDREIKDVRTLFFEVLGSESWLEFCKIYLGSKLESEWNNQVASRGVGYLDQEHPDLMARKPDWSDMVRLIENYGIGSSDAMIINFFLASSLKFIVTSDKDVAFCMARVDSPKICVTPSAVLAI